MDGMARLEFGDLRGAWKGEATDFTPLLAEQLDTLGDAIGVELEPMGQTEVATAGGRSIDTVVNGLDGTEFVVENQYGKADHDHMTRGLAYAVARGARGLVVVAEEHRDEFRAVAEYLNDLAECDPDRGISVWLVEARAARIDNSRWAPLFTTVVKPNSFTAEAERAKRAEARRWTDDEYLATFDDLDQRTAAERTLSEWTGRGHAVWRGKAFLTLVAVGPTKNGGRGNRSIVALRPGGSVMVSFGSYEGQNSGIPIAALCTDEFRARADELFGFVGSGKSMKTDAGWLTSERVEPLLEFCDEVAAAYAAALADDSTIEA